MQESIIYKLEGLIIKEANIYHCRYLLKISSLEGAFQVNTEEGKLMKKVFVLLVFCIFSAVSFCLAADLKKVDSPTIEMLQGTWEGTFTRQYSKKNASGQFEMQFQGKKAVVTRAATYTDAATRWTVTVDKIDKGKIFMSNKNSEFELELFTNAKNEFFLNGDYTGFKPGVSTKPANSSLKLQRTSTTVAADKLPVESDKEQSK